MSRPKSLVPTKRLEVKVPLPIYDLMLKNQRDCQAFGLPATMQDIIMGSLRQTLAGYANQNSEHLE